MRLGNRLVLANRATVVLASSSSASTTTICIAPPFAFMSDRKRAFEENGPSSASKKARRSVFLAPAVAALS